jgi:hypothetical protein
MAKKNLTYVPVEKLLKTCQKLGLKVIEQPSQYRIENPANVRERMYFGKGKKGVCLVDISGFTSEFAIAHPKPPTSKVTQCLDFTLPAGEILRNFYKTARLLAPKVEAPAPEPKNEEQAPAPTEETVTEQPAVQEEVASS